MFQGDPACEPGEMGRRGLPRGPRPRRLIRPPGVAVPVRRRVGRRRHGPAAAAAGVLGAVASAWRRAALGNHAAAGARCRPGRHHVPSHPDGPPMELLLAGEDSEARTRSYKW